MFNCYYSCSIYYKNGTNTFSVIFFLGPFVISSIIFLVKCINNKKKYCTDICTIEYLHELAKYPCPYYCACCYIALPKEIWSAMYMFLMVLIYVIGSAIEYYLFLLIYMFLMLLTKIFSSCFSICCPKKKEQTIPINAQNDVCETPLKPEVVFYESFVINEAIINKDNTENKN